MSLRVRQHLRLVPWWLALLLCASFSAAETTSEPTAIDAQFGAANSGPPTSFISLKKAIPEGFESLAETQSTEADVYFGGQYLTSLFIEYDLQNVTLSDPLVVAEAIPNLRDPNKVAHELSGPLPRNDDKLCTRRKRENCGELEPPVAGVIYDEGKFKLTLFINPDELLLHALEIEKYLPPSTVERSTLHNIRISAAGAGGQDRFSISSESFLAFKSSRLQSRYSISSEQSTLHEMSWQQDTKDQEYQFGSFRTQGGGLTLSGDVDLLGFYWGTSTKTRQDLDNARATPILLFLPERSRIEVFRGNELISARFYNAGNQQLDTTDFPDGAYTVRVDVIQQDGSQESQTHFFVRSGNLPPLGEPQHYVEGGTLTNTAEGGLPTVEGGAWFRSGTRHRLREDLALDAELIYTNATSLAQSSLYFIAPTWHVEGGLMFTTNQDTGLALRAGIRGAKATLNFDYRQVIANDRQRSIDDFQLINGSFTQASATLAVPISRGQLFVRAHHNERSTSRNSGIGFSYWGSLTRRGTLSIDYNLDSNFGNEDSWFRAGLTLRWGGDGQRSTVRPQVQSNWNEDGSSSIDPLLNARWSSNPTYHGIGRLDQSVLLNHNTLQSSVGARFVSEEFTNTDLELGYQRNRTSGGLFYATNSRFSVASAKGKTTVGNGGQQVGAIIIDIQGNLFGQFEVLVNDRVAGYAWANRANIISLRPYETYEVRIKPAGDSIVGYDESPQRVTLYPGNVKTLAFAAKNLVVVVSQAIHSDGTPVAGAKFLNVEGIGSTDSTGWFQVEIAHPDPLILQRRLPDGTQELCALNLGEYYVEQGLAVVEPAVCEPIRAQQLKLSHPDIDLQAHG